MPISNFSCGNVRRLLLTASACLISACTLHDSTGVLIGKIYSNQASFINANKGLEQMTLRHTAFKVAGPKGYCIDPRTLRQTKAGSFMMLASCHDLTGRVPKRFAAPAILTITVAASETPITNEEILQVASGTNAGKIIKHHRSSQTLIFQVEPNKDIKITGSEGQYWRAAMAVDDNLVALEAYVPDQSHLTALSGKTLILKTATVLKDLNPAKSAPINHAQAGQAISIRPQLRPELLPSLRPQLRPEL